MRNFSWPCAMKAIEADAVITSARADALTGTSLVNLGSACSQCASLPELPRPIEHLIVQIVRAPRLARQEEGRPSQLRGDGLQLRVERSVHCAKNHLANGHPDH